MKQSGTRVLMLLVTGVILWFAAGRPVTGCSDEVPERVRESWRLPDRAAAPKAQVRAFRLEPARVVLLDPAARELRALPV
jgi:hypothetical protein